MYKPPLLLLFIWILVGCNPDDSSPCLDASNPDCDNFDPCFFSFETTAEFTIAEQISPIPPFNTTYVEDSIVAAGEVRFRANDTTADYYKWYLGTEIIEGPDRFEVKREIQNLPLGTYNAALVVQKQTDSLCFPLDDGIDSVFRNFYKVNICNLKTANKFIGVFNEGDIDSTIIELGFYDSNLNPNCDMDGRIHAINFFGANDTVPISSRTVGITNKLIIWNGNGLGTNLKGEFEIIGEEVSATYTYQNINYNFNGKILK